jgi:hypothetical protein
MNNWTKSNQYGKKYSNPKKAHTTANHQISIFHTWIATHSPIPPTEKDIFLEFEEQQQRIKHKKYEIKNLFTLNVELNLRTLLILLRHT